MSTKSSDVVVPAASEYVLPTPPAKAAEVVVVARRRDVGATLRRGGDVARQLGERFLLLAESHQILAAEVRSRLQALDGAIADASRAQLKGALREAAAVLDWCDTVDTDMVREGRLAAAGHEPIDIAELCTMVAAERQADGPPILVSGQAGPWWGASATLAEVVGLALDLVAERSQGSGAIAVEVAALGGRTTIAVRAGNSGSEQVDPEVIGRFRRAAAELGAAVHPDASGPGGAGLVLRLPAAY
ncbi:MAG: hypothetical protein WAT39_10420 [Planctomycetota bacterium]